MSQPTSMSPDHRTQYSIRPIASDAMDAFVAYLQDHVADNGKNGVPLFQPQSRHTIDVTAEKIAFVRAGLDADVGARHWRRSWVAVDATGAISGHVDLRGRPEPCTSHRALMGIGVHRGHRGRRLGRLLVEYVISWALRETAIDWIDLTVLGGNIPAERLYRSLGFQEIATVADMFRIDGDSVPDVVMSKRIRP